MKNPNRDAAGKLAEARRILSNVEQQVAGLERERIELLLSDDEQALSKVDNEIARLGAVTHRDRIPLLEAEARRQAGAERERQREAALTKVAGKLKERAAKAAALEQAVGETVRAYSTLVAADRELRSCWQGLPTPSWWSTDQGVAGEVLYQPHVGSRRAGAEMFPQQAMRTLNGVFRTQDIGATVASQNAMLIETLRRVPLEPAVADNSPDGVDLEGVAAA